MHEENEETTESRPLCMFCEASDDPVPLVVLRYQEGEAFVCPRCLPRLIHPERGRS